MADPWTDEALREWREERQPEALGELLKSRRHGAYSLAMRITGSSADAEDVVQDAFLKLMSRTKGFGDAREFDVSVYRAVVQCALNALRQRKRRQVREAAVGEDLKASGTGGAAMNQDMSEKERLELSAILREGVQDLPEDERVPTVLCYYQGMSESQAAEVLAVPRTTLRARLSKAIGQLRRHLDKHGKKASALLILSLLWQEGVLAAPDSLGESLDKVLPGRSCSQVPAAPEPGAVGTAPIAPFALGKMAATAVVALALTLGGVAYWAQSAKGPAEEETSVAAAGPEGRRAAGLQIVPGQEGTVTAGAFKGPSEGSRGPADGKVNEVTKEDPEMKKFAAVVLAGGILFAGDLVAGEPNAEVAGLIQQIEARKVEKAEAAAKAAQAASDEKMRYVRKPGAAVQNPAPPGAGGGLVPGAAIGK